MEIILALGLALSGLFIIRLALRSRQQGIELVRQKHEIGVLKKNLVVAEEVIEMYAEEGEGHINVITMLLNEIEWMGPRAPRALPAVRPMPQIVAGKVVEPKVRRRKVRAPKVAK